MGGLDFVGWGVAVGVVVLGGVVCGGCGAGGEEGEGKWGGKKKFWGRSREEEDIEKVYTTLFSPLHMTRSQFGQILSCRRKELRVLKPGEQYCSEKITRVDSLALLLSGRLLVTQSGRSLHMIHANQFVDSPEYFGVTTDDLFQVSITAVEESRLLVWHRDKLRLVIGGDLKGGNKLGGEFLREMFDHVIGRDVVRKLVQVSDETNCDLKKSPPPETAPLVDEEEKEAAPQLLEEEEEEEEEERILESWTLGKIAEEETVV
ncbi:blood vessel epicardial substance [Folsomia candida]|nr:blood vessel epicardial substance [Folsomia candida]